MSHPSSSVAVVDDAASAVAPLGRNRSYWSLLVTQFLGAFNDNLFKQVVLLVCADYAARSATGGTHYQPLAQFTFALPFVLFSGYAGFLADRHSKRQIVVLCKVAEIAIMALGIAAYADGRLSVLLGVLFLMGMQSAFFGPAKYGILPEILRRADLPRANGWIQQTTFLAIIFGTAAGGWLKQEMGNQLWRVGMVCTVIAAVGTLTALPLQHTPIARPGLPFHRSVLAINRPTVELLRRERGLLAALLLSSLFWFVAGVVQQTVTDFGKRQIQIGDARTALLFTFTAVGIGIGCTLSGYLSHATIRFGLVRSGALGMSGCMVALAAVTEIDRNPEWLEAIYRGGLCLLGGFAGVFVVPLQTYLQAAPPNDQKGRVLGAMNLVNWIAILFSAAFYFLAQQLLLKLVAIWPALAPTSAPLPFHWVLGAMALLVLPIPLLFRRPDIPLTSSPPAS
ncbi:MAG: MFS transporter [Planctomycetota bacterium]|nr:MAG: MFS transporter [Planctomycetota bacterium]